MNSFRGYLIDAWYSGDQITLWIQHENGSNFFIRDTFQIPIHIRILSNTGEQFFRNSVRCHVFTEPIPTVRRDIWTGENVELYRVRVLHPAEFRKLLRNSEIHSDHIEYYDTDISPVHRYFLEYDLYPLVPVEVRYNEFGEPNLLPLSHRLKKERGNLPRFRSILLSAPRGRFVPLGKGNPLEIHFSESESIRSPESPEKILEFLNNTLEGFDPDLVFTHNGDEHLLPTLFSWSERLRIPLRLDRDPVRVIRKDEIRKKTFFTYGRAIAKTTPFPLFGRLHIDRGVSFFYLESDLEGIFEMSRFSRLSLQKLARSSPGSAMSAMEDETALRMGYAIPRTKGMAPDIKSLPTLLATDQGGLSFRPPLGVFEGVIELDFRSLYPNLMRLHNISGETVNCACCRENPHRVPGTPYHTCRKRRGVVGETISLLLDRRDELKEMLESKTLTEWERKVYSLRASALKWALVTSFGYTGYKHAKYGRREAHESITAHGRYALQTAKEIAEDMGYRFLHGLTDSLWLLGSTEMEKIEMLIKRITETVGIRILLEAVYSYIVFPPSKQDGEASVATRYFAREKNGSMKVRGIMTRKRDTPQLIKDFQEKILSIFSACSTAGEIREQEGTLYGVFRDYEGQILRGSISPEKLILRKYISKPFEEYSGNSASKLVLGHLLEESHSLIGGERIEYIAVQTDHGNPEKRYLPFHKYAGRFDRTFYRKLLYAAFYELTDPFIPREESLWKT